MLLEHHIYYDSFFHFFEITMAVVLHTTSGDLPVLLHCQTCPLACFNFLALCASGYYDGCHFYRHFPGILLQTGDPTNSGKGGASIYARLPATSVSASASSLANVEGHHGSRKEDEDVTATAASVAAAGVEANRYFRDEGFGTTSHARRGVLSMAHRGTKPDTNASQFFVTTSSQPAFDGVYTAFGVVDLGGVYVASSHAVVDGVTSSSPETDSAATGESVLRALEEAAADVDAKNFVTNAASVRITGATVLYNPFAEGKLRP